jgi:hypothetical protein
MPLPFPYPDFSWTPVYSELWDSCQAYALTGTGPAELVALRPLALTFGPEHARQRCDTRTWRPITIAKLYGPVGKDGGPSSEAARRMHQFWLGSILWVLRCSELALPLPPNHWHADPLVIAYQTSWAAFWGKRRYTLHPWDPTRPIGELAKWGIAHDVDPPDLDDLILDALDESGPATVAQTAENVGTSADRVAPVMHALLLSGDVRRGIGGGGATAVYQLAA